MGSTIGNVSGLPLLILITIVNSTSMAWFGYDQGVFSGALISKDFLHYFPETKKANISGITSSCFSLGAFFGCICAFTIGDKLGRKKTVILGLLANAVGAILQISSYHLPQMIVGRIINGFGMGVTSSTCPVFQAECSPFRIRGKLVVLGSLCNTAAFCLASWMNYALYHSSGPLQWRFPLGFQLVFPLIVLSCIPFIIESPRWLLLMDRQEEAKAALTRLRSRGGKVNEEELNDEFKSIWKAIQEERAERAPWTDVIRFKDSTQNLRRLFLSCGTQLMQQFSGVNALGYYLPTLLMQSVGVSNEKSRLLTGANATLYLGAAFLCLILIDLVGRRKLMLYGSLSMGTCYLVAAVTLKMADKHPESKKELGAATTAMFFLYYFCYGTSFAKIPWVYNSEINSLGWRTRGAAAATATNWMGGFIVIQFTKVGVNNLGWGFYLIFSCFCYCYFPVAYFLYMETSQRTLEDMDEIFRISPGILVNGNKILTQRERPAIFIEAEKRRIETSDKIGVMEGEASKLGTVQIERAV